MKRIAVLGAGLIGQVIIADMLEDPDLQVTVVDARRAALDALGTHPRLSSATADLSRVEEVARAAREADVVVGSVPGDLGETLVQGVLEAGRPLVDVSFTPGYSETTWQAAAAAEVPMVIDCGLAPGLSNLLAARECAALDRPREVSILVGGLPARPLEPLAYRFVFSPADVIEEYVRPCRMREDGRDVTRDALSELETVHFDALGELEAFNTDGLRTLLDSLDVPTLREKTLRYPGHAAVMRSLRDTGFFSTDAVEIGDSRVAPRDVALSLMGKALKLRPGEEEVTLLRVQVEGTRSGGEQRVVWDLVDRTHHPTGRTSMSRTTAFPCAIVTRMVARGEWTEPGMHAPEKIGTDETAAAHVLEQLEQRGVHLQRRILD